MKSISCFLFMAHTVTICEAWCPNSRFASTHFIGGQRESLPLSMTQDKPGEVTRNVEIEKDVSAKSSLWFSSDETSPLTPAQQSLQQYVERVKADLDERDFVTIEGVDCEGEPSVDPSRQVQSQGDSEWMDDW